MPTAWEGILVFVAFLVIYLSTISQYYTGDTIYYAYQVDTWLSHRLKIHMFYHFAHVFVIPIAIGFALAGKTLFGLDALTSMGIMAAFFGAGTAGLLYATVRLVGLALPHALLLATVLGCSFGFWDYSTVGEDRIQGTFFCAAFLYAFLRTYYRSGNSNPSVRDGLVTGLLLGLAVTTHLSNGLLVPFFFLCTLLFYGKGGLRSLYLWIGMGSALVVIAAGYFLVACGNQENPATLRDFFNLLFHYHSKSQPYFVHHFDLSTILAQIVRAGIGIFTVFYYVPEVYLRTTFELTPAYLRVLLAATLSIFLALSFVLVCLSRPNKVDISLMVLAGLWSVHQTLFEPISRADWLPIIFIAFLIVARAWHRCLLADSRHRGRRVAAVFTFLLPIFIATILMRNVPHMVAYHNEKNPYVQFIEFCIKTLPKDSLLVEGNSMALSSLDYFQDKYVYPFSVVTFYDVMGVQPAIFCRLKPPPNEVREIDTALAQNRPVFITKRTLEIDPILRQYLEIEYSQEVIDRFLEKYDVKPFRRDSPYSEIYQVVQKQKNNTSAP